MNQFLKTISIFQMGQWHEMGRTEVIKDNLNPEWQKKFVVNYSFEERQEIKIDVYDQGRNIL